MGCYKSNSKSEIYSAKFTYLKIEISQINNFISQATRKELSSSYRVKKDQSRNKGNNFKKSNKTFYFLKRNKHSKHLARLGKKEKAPKPEIN